MYVLDRTLCLGLDFLEYINTIGVLPVKKIELNNFAYSSLGASYIQ